MNKIIIIGGDHHNGLNLARIFGLNGYEVYAYVISNNPDSFISSSKYVKSCFVFSDENEALERILFNHSEEKHKAFLIPYSDGSALAIDRRLSDLELYFFVPGFKNNQGKIELLMNKNNQIAWANNLGIKTARSWIVDLKNSGDICQENFPCILKPNVSALGLKEDIAICKDISDFINSVQEFKNKGYYEIFVQDYLTVDFEIDVFGCICRNNDEIYLIPSKTIRHWPEKKGTNCFSKLVTDPNIIQGCEKIIKALAKDGFDGLFDIEILVVDGELVLNEVNFRNSGDDYMALSQHFYYPIYWVNDVLGINNCESRRYPLKSTYAMTAFCDVNHILIKNIGIIRWIMDVLKTSDFAMFRLNDIKPLGKRALRMVKKKFCEWLR